LKNLKYLFLSNNKITELPQDVFEKACVSLKALSISGNKLEAFPRQAIAHCVGLSHLNIGYNMIKKISPDDLGLWAGELDSLNLRNNLLTSIEAR